jgi:ATP-dependent phosphofructokinase / diphosphate-dependent phosphofructokinase
VRVGILTGGGDCPGLNAVIRAAVVTGATRYGDETVGYLDGWRGILEDRARPLDPAECDGLLAAGGTVLGTSRTNPYGQDGGSALVLSNLARRGVEALVVVGGDDTLGVAGKLASEGLRVVGVPKTIDNDLYGTEVTFGFSTAVQIATEAIDRLVTTAESHHRVIVCEVMGRNAGWIAAEAGIAGGAAEILVPEVPFDLDEVCAKLVRRHERGTFFSVLVVAEGALPADPAHAGRARSMRSGAPADAFGNARLGGIGEWLAGELERRTGFEARSTTLGHIQRGGTPTAYDRVLATRFGVAAIDALHHGESAVMVALQANSVILLPLDQVVGRSRTLDLSLLDVADPFLG